MPRRLLCLHGHFYQPPRENPWIEEIEVQDSAGPFHDWNRRIAAECYGPNGAARLKVAGDRIADIVNNYLHLSFNFGPTLLAWLERERPSIYALVLEADARSLEERGHGNAIAQGYSHAILPLCNRRDLRTQIRWGLADFRRRFERDPEGMWLPECAVDTATLAALAEEGIRFTILSPYQARRVGPAGGPLQDATGGRLDPTRPYRVRAGAKEMVVFFYDGQIARDLAFGGALASADALVGRLASGFDPARERDEILIVAFDGETLGHHKRGGDEVLAAALRRLAAGGELELVNLAQALDRIPAQWEAEISEGSSWSCAHGIERWRSDCGCQGGGQPGWNQAWRGPLRSALDGLRDRLAAVYEREAAALLQDPWRARDRFGEVLIDPDRRGADDLLLREAGRRLESTERARALLLLEMQRQAMLMYTSCGWFFSEISGLETVQVLKYAARAVQLARDATGSDLEPELLAALAKAPSNVTAYGNGARVFERLVSPSVATLEGVGAHLAIASLAHEVPAEGRVFCHRYRLGAWRQERSGLANLALGRLALESFPTGERLEALACVLHFGASDFRCGLVQWPGPERAAEVERALFEDLDRMSLAQLLRAVDRVFTGRDYTLRDLFLDERRQVADLLLQNTMRRYEDDYLDIFEDNQRLMGFLREIDSPIPGPLRAAADVSLTRRLLEVTGRAVRGQVDLASAEQEIGEAVELARRLGAHLHIAALRRDVEQLVGERVAAIVAGRSVRTRTEELVGVVDLARRMGLELDLWEAQNEVWAWARSPRMSLDREALQALARTLWLDEASLERRAGLAPPPV